MSTQQNSQKGLWMAAIAVWIIGLLLLGVGGYIWWSRQNQPAPVVEVVESPSTETDKSVAERVAESESTDIADAEVIPTDTPTPAPTPTPTPRLSVAYIGEEGNLWLTDKSGDTRQQITQDITEAVNHLNWLPDGKHIVLSGKQELILINLETGEQQKFVTHPPHSKIKPYAWSPTGTKLAYVGEYDLRGDNGDFIPIHIVEVATGEAETLEVSYHRDVDDHDYLLSDLVWANDDMLFVQVTDFQPEVDQTVAHQLFRLNLTESKTFKPILDEYNLVDGLTLSPSGEELFFFASTDEFTTTPKQYGFYHTPLTGNAPQQIPVSVHCDTACTMNWLPDGTGLYISDIGYFTTEADSQMGRILFVEWPAAEAIEVGRLPTSQGDFYVVNTAPVGQGATIKLTTTEDDSSTLYYLADPEATPQLIDTQTGESVLYAVQWEADGQALWVVNHVADSPMPKRYNLQGEQTGELDMGAQVAFNPVADEADPVVEPTDTAKGGDTLVVPTNTPAPSTNNLFNQELITFVDDGKALYTIESDGSNMTELSYLGNTVMYPHWSPDRTQIAYDGTEQSSNRTGIWIINVDGTEGTYLGNGSHPAWSPDGQKIVVDHGSEGIFIIDVITGEATNLTEGYWYPAWSPDGRTIAFYERTNGASDIYLIDPDGTNLRNLTNTPDFAEFSHNGAWSPDSRFIAFTTGERYNNQPGTPYGANGRLEIIDLETNERRKVTDVRFIGSVAWSPDGQKLVFPDYTKDNDQQLDLFIINVDGSERRQITKEDGNFYMPAWASVAIPMFPESTTSLAFADILPPTPTPSPTPEPTATPTRVYIAPTATPVPPCPNPGVQINSPAPGTVFENRYIFIVGNANIANFHHYRIEYSMSKDGHSWSYLFENDYPVDNGKLMRLDTSTVPNGPYGIRLTVVDNTGNYPEPCEVWFYNGFW